MRLDPTSLILASTTALASASIVAPVAAQEATASASAAPTGVELVGAAEDDSLAPRGNLWELGIFGGLLFVSDRNALHDPERPFADFEKPTPEVGLRLAYLPLSFLGVEGEFMGAAGELQNGDGAIVWAGRGHLLFQIPTRSVSPFVLIGGGRMGINSDYSGNDNDPELHFGGGLKVNLDRRVALRLDVRDNITKQRPEADTAHHVEALLGISLVFGRPSSRPEDHDSDGVVDLQDTCPLEQGPPPDGCPIRDRDADGFPDPKDQCPLEAGVAPDGCPVRDADHDAVPDGSDECRDVPGIAPTGCPDKDNDGVLDRDDRCLDVPGLAPHGCPPDSDGDGFVDNQDKCPNETETKNGFEDEDGCPDQIPDDLKKFTGVIPGIEFESGKADVRMTSAPVLQAAAAVLTQYPKLKVMIVGHTDNVGNHDTNVELSRRRAESVKAFLIKQGVAPDRVETRGEGPDTPIASNTTKVGRQQNRRIEFQIIK
jgi:OOP family OmpA-OmpF porin